MWLSVQISINTSLCLYPKCVYVNSLKYCIKPNRLIKNICFHLFLGNLNHMADANLIKLPFWAAILKPLPKFNSLSWLCRNNITSCGLQKHTGLWRSNDNGLALKALTKCSWIPRALQYYEQAAGSQWCHTSSSSYAKSHNKKQQGSTVYYYCISEMTTRLQEKNHL